MLTKIRNSVVGFGVLALALVIGYQFLDPGSKGREGEYTVLTLSINFTSGLIIDPVQYSIRFNGRAYHNDVTYESPWVEPIQAPPGTLVSLTTTHGEALGLSCQIHARGTTYGPNRAKPSGGKYSCVVMATA